jgi:hypothetical protein
MSGTEQENSQTETASIPQSNETANELMEIVEDRNQRDSAWELYKGYDEAYERANAERVAKRAISVEHYPQATLVAQIRVDQDGEVKSGHDYNPYAQSHRDTEAEFRRYIAETPAEQRYVIYEGNDGKVVDRDSAIRERADAGLTMFLADHAGIERTSGEPADADVASELERRGVPREETALFTTLRALGPSFLRDPEKAADLSGDVYFQLARNGIPGFREYSEEEKAAISANPEMRDELLRQMAQQANEFAISRFNPRLQKLGMPQFEVAEDGKLTLPDADGTRLINVSGPSSEGRMGEIGKMVSEYRDRHIFDTIADAVREGKKPFMVYGGSHIVALKPALDRYFGSTK